MVICRKILLPLFVGLIHGAEDVTSESAPEKTEFEKHLAELESTDPEEIDEWSLNSWEIQKIQLAAIHRDVAAAGVINLKIEDFPVDDSTKPWFIYYFANRGQNGVGKKSLPHFLNAAKKVRENGWDVNFAFHDYTTFFEIAVQEEIYEIPTIHLRMNNHTYAYGDLRTEISMVTFIERMTQPVPKQVDDWNAEFAKEYRSGGIFVQKENDEHFDAVAQEMRGEATFACGKMPPGISSQGAHVIVHRPAVLEPVIRSTPQIDIEWARANKFPGVWFIYDQATFIRITSDDKPTVVVAVDMSDELLWSTIRSKLIALEQRGFDCNIAVIDGTIWGDALAPWGLYRNRLPHFTIFKDHRDTWVEDQEDLTLEMLFEAEQYRDLWAKAYSQELSISNKFYLMWRESIRNRVRYWIPRREISCWVCFIISMIFPLLGFFILQEMINHYRVWNDNREITDTECKKKKNN